jgi:hypothetical protein
VRLRLPLRVVGLVGHQQDRPPGAAEDRRQVQVGGGQTVTDVHQEEDQVRLFHRHFRLVLDDRAVRILGPHPQAARVDDQQLPALPIGLPIDAVARDPRRVLDNRFPLADQPVEEGGLPDIRPADDRNHRSGHGSSSPGVPPQSLLYRSRPGSNSKAGGIRHKPRSLR